MPAGLNDLVDKVRAKYPGAYDDLDDGALTKMLLAKYPQYSDLAAPKLQQPVQVESSAMDKTLGALAPQPVPRTQGAGRTQGDLPGFEGSYASGDTDKGAVMTGAGVVTGAALAAPAVAGALRTAAAAHPLVAKVIVKGLEGLGFAGGLKVGAKYIKLGEFLGGQ